MQPFKAFRIHSPAGGDDARLETITLDDLSEGDVVIRGEYSSINYKDALAGTGEGKILRKYPLVGGVDVAGTVVESGDPRIATGTKVVVTGGELSETRDGGFAEFVRVPGELAIPGHLTVCDLVYNPQETLFLTQSRAAGAELVYGLGMLVYQGAAALEMWTGHPAPVETMREACLEALASTVG